MKKKKKIVLLISIIIIVLIISTLTTIFYYQKNSIKKMKNNYSEYVITTKETSLYNKNRKKIGTISSGYILNLDKITNNSYKHKYFKIANSSYYIKYNTIKKSKKKNNVSNTNYIMFNKNIKTKNKVYLIQNNKKIIMLTNGINTPIEYMDKEYYYVRLLNDVFKIKKSTKIKVINKQNTNEKKTDYISVIHYEKITNELEDNNCIETNIAIDQIQSLIDNGYHFITKEQYKMFINNNIQLKEKSILLTTSTLDESVKKIMSDLNITIYKITKKDNLNFISTNKKSTVNDDKLNRYQIKTYTTNEDILKMAQGEEVINTPPINSETQKIAVLNYHFFYDPTSQTCDEVICLEVDKFRSHLQYFKDNGFKTLTMKEFTSWIYGKIDLPEKSVLITVDDGAMGTGKHNGNHLITLLEEYKMHATLFLIAGWWDISNYQSKYLEVQSHTYDMHKYGDCGKGQLVCANYEEAKADLQKSLDIIKDNTSFCYPFYRYDDEAIQAIKDLGFKTAFVGGNTKANRSNNKYLIPRYPIQNDVTLQDIIKIVN